MPFDRNSIFADFSGDVAVDESVCVRVCMCVSLCVRMECFEALSCPEGGTIQTLLVNGLRSL